MEKKPVQDALNAILRNGEQVRWEGRTEPFALLADDAKGQIFGKWIGTGIAAVAILTLYIKNTGGDKVEVIGMVLLVAVALILAPFIERHNVMGQYYCITDQRVIMITASQTVYYMELSDIDEYQVVSGRTEYHSLVLGSCVFEDIKRQLRWRACHPKADPQSSGTNGQVFGIVLFNVKESGDAEKILMEKAKRVSA